MAVHVTKYETKNGKTRKVKREDRASKEVSKDVPKDTADNRSGAGNQGAGNTGNKGV